MGTLLEMDSLWSKAHGKELNDTCLGFSVVNSPSPEPIGLGTTGGESYIKLGVAGLWAWTFTLGIRVFASTNSGGKSFLLLKKRKTSATTLNCMIFVD